MKRFTIAIYMSVILGWLVPLTAQAGDYMVQLFQEHYNEKMITGTGDMKVDHTWEVKTRYGSKVLILIGNDYSLRQWIRADAEKQKLWVLKIPDEGDEKFKYSLAVFVELQQLYPVNGKKWECRGCRSGQPPAKTEKSIKQTNKK